MLHNEMLRCYRYDIRDAPSRGEGQKTFEMTNGCVGSRYRWADASTESAEPLLFMIRAIYIRASQPTRVVLI